MLNSCTHMATVGVKGLRSRPACVHIWSWFCFRVHRGKSVTDEASEISSTEARCYGNSRLGFDAAVTSKLHKSSLSQFAEKTMSPFSLPAYASVHSISPKKSPLSTSAAAVVGISQLSSGISGAGSFPADRRVGAGSSFMKSDHISRLNFNSVSTTTSASGEPDSAGLWLNSFRAAHSPGVTLNSPPQPPIGALTSPSNSLDDMSPPVLKPKVRRASHRTPDKSPLVTSSSDDMLELGKPSVGLGEPPGSSDSDIVDFESRLSRSLTVLDAGINSTLRKFSSPSDIDEQPLCDRLTAKPAAASSRRDSYSSTGSDHRNSHKTLKPNAKEKTTSKSGSRSAKQKAKSPAVTAELYERQRAELDNAFEAACRLPSTVGGQPSSSMNSSRSSLDRKKVSCSLPLS